MTALVECVPNFSEGRSAQVVHAIRDAIAASPGALVLDVSMDASHNRSVITFVAPPDRVVDAALAGVREAQARIDLTTHAGCHPRLGAADVVPLVPLDGVTMAECVALARELGRRIGDELAIPVYLYEHAATRPARRNLAEVRRGGFEGLRDLVGTDPARDPDFGPRALHPTCGAVAVGARDLLVAYNVYLGPAANLDVARRVARAVRGSSGGLRGVKALALVVDGQAQVSMNLVDLDATPLHQAFELVKHEAAAHGVSVAWSEVVGLVPERALLLAGARHVQLRDYAPGMVLERRVREACDAMRAAASSGDPGGARWLERVASADPAPGGGSAAAYAGALGAALAGMVAALAERSSDGALPDDVERTALRPHVRRAAALRDELYRLSSADAAAYASVAAARRLPQSDESERTRRAAALAAALLESTVVPRDTARAAAELAELALLLLRDGPRYARSDALAAVALADAACAAARATVRANARLLARLAAPAPDDRGPALAAETDACARRARQARDAAEAAVDADADDGG